MTLLDLNWANVETELSSVNWKYRHIEAEKKVPKIINSAEN